MAQMGTALAVFCFLPFCQAERANIIVDTFTVRLSERARARIDAFWDALYALAMGVIGYAMLPGVSALGARAKRRWFRASPCGPRLRSQPRLFSCLQLLRRGRLGASCGARDERDRSGDCRLRPHARAHRRAPARGPCDARDGRRGYAWISSWPAFLAYMKTNSYHQFANYTLSVIPLFILMGALAEHSGLSTKLFRAAACLVGRLRGGLAYAVFVSCAGFGAICGSSVATTATFGRAALPELERYKYDGGFATGVIAVGGRLAFSSRPRSFSSCTRSRPSRISRNCSWRL